MDVVDPLIKYVNSSHDNSLRLWGTYISRNVAENYAQVFKGNPASPH